LVLRSGDCGNAYGVLLAVLALGNVPAVQQFRFGYALYFTALAGTVIYIGLKCVPGVLSPRGSTAPSLIPTVNGDTVRSFSTHGQLSTAQGSSTTVSRIRLIDIRLIQHLDSSAHGLVRRWRLIGYFPIHFIIPWFHRPASSWCGKPLSNTPLIRVGRSQGLLAPFLTSAALFAVYCVITYLPDLDLKTLLSGYFWLLGTVAISGNLKLPLNRWAGKLGGGLTWRVGLPQWLGAVDVNTGDTVTEVCAI
jgi:hypothetical protein